jgi:hypothetical protein
MPCEYASPQQLVVSARVWQILSIGLLELEMHFESDPFRQQIETAI